MAGVTSKRAFSVFLVTMALAMYVAIRTEDALPFGMWAFGLIVGMVILGPDRR